MGEGGRVCAVNHPDHDERPDSLPAQAGNGGEPVAFSRRSSVAQPLVQGFLVSSFADGVAEGAAPPGAGPGPGLTAGAAAVGEAGSSGLQPTTTIIANAALAKNDKALIAILAITDALLDVKHVTSRVVTLEYPVYTL